MHSIRNRLISKTLLFGLLVWLHSLKKHLKELVEVAQKKNMQYETLAAEASGSNAFIPASSSSVHAAQAGPSITVN